MPKGPELGASRRAAGTPGAWTWATPLRRVVALDVLAHLGRSLSIEAPAPVFAGETQAEWTSAASPEVAQVAFIVPMHTALPLVRALCDVGTGRRPGRARRTSSVRSRIHYRPR